MALRPVGSVPSHRIRSINKAPGSRLPDVEQVTIDADGVPVRAKRRMTLMEQMLTRAGGKAAEAVPADVRGLTPPNRRGRPSKASSTE